jgi:hypothetical protein
MVYFEKSMPAPECLLAEKIKANGDYKCGETLDRIKVDFKNKCYICELKAPTTINIEHFKPHKGNIDLKFSWKNLFWSCGHCNNIKLGNYDNIIDCTADNENIEERIKLSIKAFPMEKVKVEALDDEPSTISTAKLLDAVYNGTTKLKTIESNNLREKIQTDIADFRRWLFDFYKEDIDEDEKRYCRIKIRYHLRKSSSFTMFKRAIIKDNEILKADFEKYFD